MKPTLPIRKFQGKQGKKHLHIWKYDMAGWRRTCEAPIRIMEGCGEVQVQSLEGKWGNA